MADAILSRQFVEFSAKGLDKLQQQTDAYRERLTKADVVAKELNRTLNQGAISRMAEQFQAGAARIATAATAAAGFFGKLKEGAAMMAGPATAGFAMLSAAILGFARAGLQGTVEGNRLTMQWQFLSREIASVFLPVIHKVIETLGQAVQWFRSLTGAKQEAIMKFALATTVALGLVMVMPRLFGGIQMVILGVRALMVAIAQAGVSAGVASGGLIPLIGLLVTGAIALGAFLTQTRAGGVALDKLREVAQRIATAVMPILNRLAQSFGEIMERLGESTLPLIVTTLEIMAQQVEFLTSAINGLRGALDELDKHSRTLGTIARSVSPLLMRSPEQDESKGPRKSVTLAGGGPEDAMATYNRILQAALSVAKPDDPAEKTAVAAGQIAGHAEKTKDTLREIKDFLERYISGRILPQGMGG